MRPARCTPAFGPGCGAVSCGGLRSPVGDITRLVNQCEDTLVVTVDGQIYRVINPLWEPHRRPLLHFDIGINGANKTGIWNGRETVVSPINESRQLPIGPRCLTDLLRQCVVYMQGRAWPTLTRRKSVKSPEPIDDGAGIRDGPCQAVKFRYDQRVVLAHGGEAPAWRPRPPDGARQVAKRSHDSRGDNGDNQGDQSIGNPVRRQWCVTTIAGLVTRLGQTASLAEDPIHVFWRARSMPI